MNMSINDHIPPPPSNVAALQFTDQWFVWFVRHEWLFDKDHVSIDETIN